MYDNCMFVSDTLPQEMVDYILFHHKGLEHPVANILKKSKSEKGKKFKIIEVPMPSPIYIKNTRVPASYMNFYICNKKIILPTFRVKEDNIAIKIFKNYFINKKIETVDCSKLIWGFGAIHCMTQQEPKI